MQVILDRNKYWFADGKVITKHPFLFEEKKQEGFSNVFLSPFPATKSVLAERRERLWLTLKERLHKKSNILTDAYIVAIRLESIRQSTLNKKKNAISEAEIGKAR
ncbi:hypothetical protein TNIN_79601 [Trichonephila inaurata madagascariensis]|uniref:Uncharacterized protein n=1 Tax=Trichonephila inaurata madagascariensis TaxID=2747483 RepID=A0A8X7BZD2_9ARAC|nr:hypothetical protein TNIN_79601 [Trichonephila inaurata madagascariensis]